MMNDCATISICFTSHTRIHYSTIHIQINKLDPVFIVMYGCWTYWGEKDDALTVFLSE